MQRNKQLIHETLELIAAEAERFDASHEKGVTPERVDQLQLLNRSGFLTFNEPYASRFTSNYVITWKGYDLLDELREVYGEQEYVGM
jgi:2-oxo-4-hydroxy-4-carboxy--5-ureidoimidazoline (OHCU) decarboxylase